MRGLELWWVPLTGQQLEGPAPTACWEGQGLGVRGLEPSGSPSLLRAPSSPNAGCPSSPEPPPLTPQRWPSPNGSGERLSIKQDLFRAARRERLYEVFGLN